MAIGIQHAIEIFGKICDERTGILLVFQFCHTQKALRTKRKISIEISKGEQTKLNELQNLKKLA